MKSNYFTLYGISNYMEIIDEIINELNVSDESFDVKLILTEAVTNAFYHGNNSDSSKPIYLRYFFNEGSVRFEIEDCSKKPENLLIPKTNLEEGLLNDTGRGLFIINSLSDKVELKENTFVIYKSFNKFVS